MARRKAPPAPADDRRRQWVASALGLYGWRFLADKDDRVAWLAAWRRFAYGEAALPVAEDLFAQAVEAWPDRSNYAECFASRTPLGVIR